MSISHRKSQVCIPRFAAIAIGFLAIHGSGCGGPATESVVATETAEQQQVKALAKKGMNFAEIRKTLRGETIEPRPKTKKKPKGR